MNTVIAGNQAVRITKKLLDRSACFAPSPCDQIAASPMVRLSPALPAIALLACANWPGAAQEQTADPVINVYFQPLEGGEFNLLNKAIQEALSQPPFQLAGKPFAGVVVVTVQGKVESTHKKVSGTY